MESMLRAPWTSRLASRLVTEWLSYDFDLEAERLVESVELLLSVATAVSVVDLLASRLADLLLELVFDRDLSDEAVTSSEADLSLVLLEAASSEADWSCDLLAEASSEADLSLVLLAEASSEADWSCDLLAEASSEALADLESVADRLLSEDLEPLAERVPLPLLVPAEVPDVVLLPFVPEPSASAVMSFDVPPLEAELSAPLVAALSKDVVLLLVPGPVRVL